MKTIKGSVRKLCIVTVLILLSAGVTNAQYNPYQVTAVKANVEGAIQLNWQSETNAYYRVQYADQLNGNDDGTTAWNTICENYPSHGTNTFWLDAGDYTSEPAIPHPKNMPMRFYRVAVQGVNTANPPNVVITSPANGNIVQDEITVVVSANSDQPIVRTELYVDGQLMPSSDDGTNYIINTCEWPNGPHTLFAVARSQSGYEGLMNAAPIAYGRAVSSYVSLTFSNLISRYSFSQPFFEPDLGQTQQVSAVFTANVNWTLEVQDQTSNDVLYVTGNGTSMQYNWDGTGTNGISLPNGVYTFFLTAQPNGQPMPMFESPPLAVNSSLSVSDTMADGWFPTNAKEAVISGFDYYYMQPPPMPPVWTNGAWASWEDVYGAEPLIKVKVSLLTQKLFSSVLASEGSIDGKVATDNSLTLHSLNAQSSSSSSSQSTRGPGRPEVDPIFWTGKRRN